MSSGPTPSRPAAPSPAPARAARGGQWSGRGGLLLPVLLILAGVLVLLVNFGYVSGQQLVRVFDLWPAALVLLGLVLIFRTRLPQFVVPIAVAIAIVLVVGALAYGSVPAGLRPTTQSDHVAPLGSATDGRLELNLAAGSTTVESQDMADLYRAHLEYPRGAAPDVSAQDGTVKIGGGSHSTLFGGGGTLRARVTLNGSIPWEIHVGGGASQVTLRLGQVGLKRLEISGGANHVEATLSKPKGTVPIQISGGATNVTLHRPSGTAARAVMSGGANNLKADGKSYGGFSGEASWRSPDYDGANDRYEIEVSGGAGNVKIDQR